MGYFEQFDGACSQNTYWPKDFTIDPGLMSQAQAEAEAVANGAMPKGVVECGGNGNCQSGGTTPPDPVQSMADWFYIDGIDGSASGPTEFDSDHLMFTAPESNLDIGGGYINCHFENSTQGSRDFIYHYCPTAGPKATRMGCGSAVDTTGTAWRVLLEGP